MTVSTNRRLKPFLTIPFAQGTTPLEISQGWNYSSKELMIHPDIKIHHGVDFQAEWGTPIYAPADGWAIASYHTHDITDSCNRLIGYGLGLFVAIWHEDPRLYTTYAHLSGINQVIPYLHPVEEEGDWQPRSAIYRSTKKFTEDAIGVNRGDLIGYVGYTGLRLDYEEHPSVIPTINPKVNGTWDPAGSHLHWEVYNRTPDGATKQLRLDPFGLNDELALYSDALITAKGLILPNADGSPQFAR